MFEFPSWSLLFLAYLTYVESKGGSYGIVMFCYVLVKHERLYCGLVSIKKRDMSKSGHIVHRNNRTTVKHIYRRKKCQTHKKKLKQSS